MSFGSLISNRIKVMNKLKKFISFNTLQIKIYITLKKCVEGMIS